MPFTEVLAQIPQRASTLEGRGFLPPMIRANNHLVYLLSHLASEQPPTDEEALTEIANARRHWDARTPTTSISTAAAEKATLIGQLLAEFQFDFVQWDTQQRIQNTTAVIHRVADFGAFLDWEYAGIRDSDAGTSL